jgi:hypothetical protein
MSEQKLSASERRALDILKSHPGITARIFAEHMWPGSKGWSKSKNTGRGSTRGKGMWLAAGSYLAKLSLKGVAHAESGRGGVRRWWAVFGAGK